MSDFKTNRAEMEWQEFYLLNSNGTFIKSRVSDRLITEESDTFAYTQHYCNIFYENTVKIEKVQYGARIL
jgi:hypothetical protein